ncbi:MAG: queuosine salvage family protein [Candidatus Uhrbacteria bacterium]
MENKVLNSARRVAKQSRHVSIEQNAINYFCKDFSHQDIKHWLEEAPFDIQTLNEEDRLNFMLVFNAISFSYWGEPKWTIEYHGKEYDGSWAMIACIARAIEEEKPILDSKYLASISEDEFADILRGSVEIPLFKQRWEILREVGQVLNNKFDGEFKNLVQSAEGDALKLVQIIIDNFSGFEDAAEYKSEPVYFYKRSQLLVADIYQAFQGKGLSDLKNINLLTACADYKLPQMLRKMGITKYSDELADKVDRYREIPSGSEEEVEIRANTIWATELIRQQLKNSIPDISSIHVNDHLWLISQTKSSTTKPYHRTRTTAY